MPPEERCRLWSGESISFVPTSMYKLSVQELITIHSNGCIISVSQRDRRPGGWNFCRNTTSMFSIVQGCNTETQMLSPTPASSVVRHKTRKWQQLFMPQLSKEEICTMQQQNSDLKQIVQWLYSHSFPPKCPQGSTCLKTLWHQRSYLTLHDGILYRQ